MASQGFVIDNTNGRTKAQGLAHLFAGLYAGSICGGAAGGIVAERYGYRVTFLLGAVMTGMVIAYALGLMRGAMRQRPREAESAVVPGENPQRLVRFLFNRSVVALTLFSSLPASIAVVGFLNYFAPVYLHGLGASEGTIGKLLVIYGICLIYCGPIMGRYADCSQNKRRVIFVGCLLGSAAFLAFGALQGVVAAAVAIFLMGLSHSFILSSQSAYMLELTVTRELGPGKAMGIFRASSRFGQMIGPVVFAGLAMTGSVRAGVGLLGVLYAVLACAFVVVTRRGRPMGLRVGA